jgi:hypothetical protein
MGYSTRVDVQLRGAAPVGSRTGPESFTDLDVLGVLVGPGHHLSTTIADCKSGTRDKPTSRMFWARGVADFFGADHAMLVRQHEVADATRQLSGRLNITVLSTADLAAMQQLHGPALRDPAGPLALLFDKSAVEAAVKGFNGLDKKLRPLLDYREFDYWLYDQRDNPIQLVAHLTDAKTKLDPANPVHLALFLDLAWLYLVSLIQLASHVRGAFVNNVDRGIQEYLLGGATGVREKQDMAEMFDRMKPEGTPELGYLPSYYPTLRELVARLLRRPAEMQTALRYAEVASALMVARKRIPLKIALGGDFDPIAAKLVADVCGFLVAASELDTRFRAEARAYLLAEPVVTT